MDQIIVMDRGVWREQNQWSTLSKKLSLLLMVLSEGKRTILSYMWLILVLSLCWAQRCFCKTTGNVIVRQCRRKGDRTEVCVRWISTASSWYRDSETENISSGWNKTFNFKFQPSIEGNFDKRSDFILNSELVCLENIKSKLGWNLGKKSQIYFLPAPNKQNCFNQIFSSAF